MCCRPMVRSSSREVNQLFSGVPHDVFGMMDLMGGERVFVDKLDKLFSMHLPEKYYEHNEDITEECLVGGYVHGNEPTTIPYLYAWTSEPWKTQYWLREILNKMYRNDINGLGGTDDCGQMSAWYLFSVMGFYPVCPGTDGLCWEPRICLISEVETSQWQYIGDESTGRQ